MPTNQQMVAVSFLSIRFQHANIWLLLLLFEIGNRNRDAGGTMGSQHEQIVKHDKCEMRLILKQQQRAGMHMDTQYE